MVKGMALLCLLCAPSQARAGLASVRAVEDLLERTDHTVLTGMPSLELPAPLNDSEEIDLVYTEVLSLARELGSAEGLKGTEHFEKHPDSPRIEASLRRWKDPDAPWFPEPGPVRYHKTSYTVPSKTAPPEARGGHPPLHSVRIPIDAGFYWRLSAELDQVYGRGRFRSPLEKARRIALFLAPRAVADLELARVMDELELPNYVRVDALEEMRLLYEWGALRAVARDLQGFLREPSFKLTPSEMAYLEGASDNGRFWSPSSKHVSELCRGEWISRYGLLGESRSMPRTYKELIPYLSVGSGRDLETAESLNASPLDAAISEAKKRIAPGAPDRVKFYDRLLWLLSTRGWLSEPGSLNALRNTAEAELEAARFFYSKGLPKRDADTLMTRIHLAKAREAAVGFDSDGLKAALAMAAGRARAAGIAFDSASVEKTLREEFLTVKRGISLLKHESIDVRERAAQQLGEMGASAKEAIPELLRVVQESNYERVWIAAAAALGRMGPEATPALLAALNNHWKPVRSVITDGLAQRGSEVIPALAIILQEGASRSSYGAAEALGKIGRPALPVLLEALKSRNPRVRELAAMGLGLLGAQGEDAIDPLAKLLFDKKEAGQIRDAAAESLALIGPETLPVWIKALGQADGELRRKACSAVRIMGPDAEQAIPHLFALIEKDRPECYDAASALAAIGPPAIPAAVKALKSPAYRTRLMAVYVLGTMGPMASESAPALRELLKTETVSELRDLVKQSLQAMGEE